MSRIGNVREFRASSALLLTAALALANPFGCGGSGGNGGNKGGNGGDTDEGGSGGSGGEGGKATGGKGGAGGKGGTSGGGSGGATGGSGGSAGGEGGSTGEGGEGGSSSGGKGGSTSADGGAADASGGKGGSGPSADGGSKDGAPVTGVFTGNGCAGGTCLNAACKAAGTPAAIGTFADLDFANMNDYIPQDVVIPTFDDVPDRPYTSADGMLFMQFQTGDWTNKLLDFLDSKNLHVDFFVNANNFCNVEKTPSCQEAVKRIMAKHNIASHSVHHVHFGVKGTRTGIPANFDCGISGSMYKCDEELQGVETLVNTLSGGGIPHLTRFRAPYGQPFQDGAPDMFKTVVAKFAVHVGWAMESLDADHDDDGNDLGAAFFANNVMNATGGGPGKGAHGLILMHGTYPWSVGEAKLLLDPAASTSLQKHGFKLGTVEDAVCWKYGKHSWEIIQALTNQPHGPN